MKVYRSSLFTLFVVCYQFIFCGSEAWGTTKDFLNINLTARCKVHTVVDVHAPQNYAGLPIVITLHGGGWLHGSRESMRPYAQRLAESGFVTVNVDYFLSDAIPLTDLVETQLRSIDCVRGWAVSELAKNMKLAGRRIGIIGHSAGGHLAVASALRQGGSRYSAYVGWSGAYQLRRFYPNMFKSIESLKRIDPMNLVRKRGGKGLLIHGSADELLDISDAKEFYGEMKKARQSIHLGVTSGGHNLNSPDYYNWTVSFLATALKGVSNPQWNPVSNVPPVKPPSEPGRKIWTCTVGLENNALWMRSRFAGKPQFAWRIGAGGAIAELRDMANNNQSLLAPSYAGEVTDRVIQWTIWNMGLAVGPQLQDRMNVTQAGTRANIISPSMAVSLEQSEQKCVARVLSHPQDQWSIAQDEHFQASFPALTTYEFSKGVLTINREILLEALYRDGRAISATDFYIEAWTPFTTQAFNSVALSLDGRGNPKWFYRAHQNIPHYPNIPLSKTNGYALLYHSDRRAIGPVLAVLFGRGSSGSGFTRALNFMDFNTGLAVLPSIRKTSVPIGSIATQQIKLYMTRGISSGLQASLKSLAATIKPPVFYEPGAPTSSAIEASRSTLKSVGAMRGYRTDNLGEVSNSAGTQ